MGTEQRTVSRQAKRRIFLAVCSAAVLAAAAYLGYRFLTTGREGVAGQGPVMTETAHPAAAKQLYDNHCAACHGENGDGDGPAARFLYPKPRNFRLARFRLVTTTNRQPSDDDLFRTISRGMPGSAMFSFGHLTEDQRRGLVAHVRDLTRAGMVAHQRAVVGDDVPEAELLEDVDQAVRPSGAVEVPADLPAFDPESVARGKLLYKSESCNNCHGETGKGDGAQDQRDDLGVPIRPRDLTRGVFKGGHEPRDLYARLVLGMPGTPMPAFTTYTTTQLGDMINYALSLSDPAARARAEHRRVRLAARRVPALPADGSDAAWSPAATAALVVSPLWWREYADPDLRVAVVHDGRTLAVRLTWLDATPNESAGRPEDFVDMAAVQLFKGAPEPFLGMGALPQLSAAGGPGGVDLWLWRAGWPRTLASGAGPLDDYPLATPLYRELLKKNGTEPPDLFTARAAGNPLAGPDPGQTAASLGARGFGSTTFRPKASQRIEATGAWKEGRWTVVLTRPMAVGAEDGISLAPGEICSVAFALWDGAARDRNGQKLVTVWNDLVLE
jgi:mono/diheme cytochrome c family protein